MSTDDTCLHHKLVIAHGVAFSATVIKKHLNKQQIRTVQISNLRELQQLTPALLILDQQLLAALMQEANCEWHKPESLQIIAEEQLNIEDKSWQPDLYVPKGFHKKVTQKHIESALQRYILCKQQKELTQLLADKSVNLERMTNIGIALSAEKNLAALLSRVLNEGRKLACCDAAALFLLDNKDSQKNQLILKLSQNASIDFDFEEQRFPLNDNCISGYVATHGVELNINDVYQLEHAPYRFNRIIDDATGYRCMSLLALPIQNHRGEIIGVIQFINRTKKPDICLSSHQLTHDNVIAFDDSVIPLLRALASQSAIAIENRRLIESISSLFEGFVQASVTAIEQRDPATSGHSFRVADLSIALAKCLPGTGLYKNQLLNDKDLRQLKYAALLHDFGKVGVRESVLTKAKKLTAHQLDVIKYRIRLTQQTLLRQRAETELKLFQKSGCCDAKQQLGRQEQIQQHIVQLEQFWQDILLANEPSILPESLPESLQQIHAYQVSDESGILTPLINQQELQALSIPKGSLNQDEMSEIRSHVIHTENFLKQIPWTQELQDVSNIAAAHHEKRDGSGYPRGLNKDQIPLASQIMTVCDIYDALTAADRPYKSAASNKLAFKILQNEAEKQQLNGDLVRLFIDAKVYLVIKDKHYSKPSGNRSCFHHHVCDFNLLDHN